MNAFAEELPGAVCLAGPTGAGKTALAIRLAQEFDCEIINGDSRQVYGDFPIITAQPDERERSEAVHHLYGMLAADRQLCAQAWAELAAQKCREIAARGKLPLIVGGTGFYFEALLKGLAPIPEIPEAIAIEIQMELSRKGLPALYKELSRVDPEYAGQIHPHDWQRVMRALEVYAASAKPFSWWHRQTRKPVVKGPLLIWDAPLDWLSPRLAKRIEEMVRRGAFEEVALALEQYPHKPKAGFSSLGCGEICSLLEGAISLAECLHRWVLATRSYAKRQLTWFRGRGEGISLKSVDSDQMFRECAAFLNQYMRGAQQFHRK